MAGAVPVAKTRQIGRRPVGGFYIFVSYNIFPCAGEDRLGAKTVAEDLCLVAGSPRCRTGCLQAATRRWMTKAIHQGSSICGKLHLDAWTEFAPGNARWLRPRCREGERGGSRKWVSEALRSFDFLHSPARGTKSSHDVRHVTEKRAPPDENGVSVFHALPGPSTTTASAFQSASGSGWGARRKKTASELRFRAPITCCTVRRAEAHIPQSRMMGGSVDPRER